jgi:hypothetical protein
MRYQTAILCLCTLRYAQALKPKKSDKVVLSTVEAERTSTLTFYSVYVPEWLTPTETEVPLPKSIAKEATIPEVLVDPSKKPTDYDVTFPSILLNSARVRYTEGVGRIQISCKAAGGETIVSYEVPSDTAIDKISHLFTEKEASQQTPSEAPAFVVNFLLEDPAGERHDSDNTIKSLAHAWLGMQDFCTMLINLRQLFLNTLRDKMVEQLNPIIMAQIAAEDRPDFSTSEMVSESNGAGITSPITSARILNIGDTTAEIHAALNSELDAVIKRGRCLGQNYQIDEQVLAAQEPVVALVTTPSASTMITVQCFSFFEGKIVPVIEITEPEDADKCKEGTTGLAPADTESAFEVIGEDIMELFKTVIGIHRPKVPKFRVIHSTSTHASADSPDNDAKIQKLCQRLTQDYLLIVRDDAIKCTDCLFKYNVVKLKPDESPAKDSPLNKSSGDSKSGEVGGQSEAETATHHSEQHSGLSAGYETAAHSSGIHDHEGAHHLSPQDE